MSAAFKSTLGHNRKSLDASEVWSLSFAPLTRNGEDRPEAEGPSWVNNVKYPFIARRTSQWYVTRSYGRGRRGGNPMVRLRRRSHRMRRVLMLLAVLLAAGMTGPGVMAQRPSGVPHVGVLVPTQNRQMVDAFRAGMRALGWTEGGNVVIEVRYGNSDPALWSANAVAFVAEKVDVIVAFGDTAEPARRATATIPIVMD